MSDCMWWCRLSNPGRDLMTFLCESCLATLAVVCVCKIEVESDPQAADKWTREICYSTVSVGSFQHGLINYQLGNKATWFQRSVGGCPCPSLIKRVRHPPPLPISFLFASFHSPIRSPRSMSLSQLPLSNFTPHTARVRGHNLHRFES